MAKKAIENKSSYISDKLMKEFTKITLDNIKEFFESKTLFIILIQEGSKKDGFKYIIANQFITRDRFISKSNIIFTHIFDGKIISRNVDIKTTELEEDYNNAVSDMKVLIKEYIKREVLYGKQI